MAADPLRFCMVTTFYPPYHFGGDGVFVYRLAEALAGLGHHVDVVHSIDAYRIWHPAEPEIAFTHHPNVTVHGLQTRHPLLAALAVQQLGRPMVYRHTLGRLLEGSRHDVIHYHNVSLMGAPAVFGLGAAVKLYTTHEYWLICPTHVLFRRGREACAQRSCLACALRHGRPPQAWRYLGRMRRRLRHVDCILTPSRFALQQHRQQGIDRPMVVLPHFVPGPTAADAASRDPGPPGDAGPSGPAGQPDRPFFLYVGRLEYLKGVQELIEIFRDYRAADLVVIGDGGLEPDLRRQAADLPHVRFLGAVHPSKLGPFYRRAVALLVPSLCYEAFALTAAEGLSHGVPVIVRRIGALAEIVEDSGGGLSFDSRRECVAAMEQVRTNPSLRAELGTRGQEAWRRLWSPDVHLRRYLELVQAQLAQRRGAGGDGDKPADLRHAAPGRAEVVE